MLCAIATANVTGYVTVYAIAYAIASATADAGQHRTVIRIKGMTTNTIGVTTGATGKITIKAHI